MRYLLSLKGAHGSFLIMCTTSTVAAADVKDGALCTHQPKLSQTKKKMLLFNSFKSKTHLMLWILDSLSCGNIGNAEHFIAARQ